MGRYCRFCGCHSYCGWPCLVSLCDQLFDPPQLKQLMSFSTLASSFALACFLITSGLFVQLFSFGRHLVIVTSWTASSNRKVIISTRNLPPHQLCGSCSCYLVLVKGFSCFYQKRINATALCSFWQAVIRCRGSPSRQYLSLRHFLLTSWKVGKKTCVVCKILFTTI